MNKTRREQIHSLAVCLADGDRAAFEPLFDLLWPLMSRFAERLLGDPQAAQDAAQQALLSLFRRAGELDRSRDALSWVFGIVAWECRSVRRRRQRRREEPLSEVEGAMGLWRDPGSAADEVMISRQLSAAATAVLDDLQPLDAETLWAAARGERPPSVAAATFRKRLERARLRLRKAWRMRHGSL